MKNTCLQRDPSATHLVKSNKSNGMTKGHNMAIRWLSQDAYNQYRRNVVEALSFDGGGCSCRYENGYARALLLVLPPLKPPWMLSPDEQSHCSPCRDHGTSCQVLGATNADNRWTQKYNNSKTKATHCRHMAQNNLQKSPHQWRKGADEPRCVQRGE